MEEAADWVQHLSGQVPPDLYTEYDRLLRTLTPREQRKASEDVETFALYLGKALSKLRSRQLQPPAPVDKPAPASLFTHQQQREGVRLERLKDVIPGHPRLVDSFGKAFNACPDCYFKACPKANDKSGLCDVREDRHVGGTRWADASDIHSDAESIRIPLLVCHRVIWDPGYLVERDCYMRAARNLGYSRLQFRTLLASPLTSLSPEHPQQSIRSLPPIAY